MISCDEVLDMLPETVPVLLGDALRVHEHLKVCADCQEEADQVAHTLAVLKDDDDVPDLGDDFADKVLAALPPGPPAAHPAPAASDPAAGGSVIKLAPAIPGWLQAAAAAAVFACGVGVARLIDRNAAPQPQPQQQAQLPAPPQPTPATGDPARRRALPVSASADPLGSYVSEASLVLKAVESLDTGDPKVLALLRKHLERTELLEQGEQLMLVLDRDPRRGKKLRPLIRGTQLILRKVRHTDQRNARAAVWAIRQEVRQTRILEAYRDLTQPDARPTQPGVINVNDPL